MTATHPTLASLYLSSDDIQIAGLVPRLSRLFDSVQADDGRICSSVLRWRFERRRMPRPSVLIWHRSDIDAHSARDLLRIQALGIAVIVMVQLEALEGLARGLLTSAWRNGTIEIVPPHGAEPLLELLVPSGAVPSEPV